jgi:hypothetical protein
MATISIYNASANAISIHTDVAVNDLMDNDADLNFVRTRHVAKSSRFFLQAPASWTRTSGTRGRLRIRRARC